MADRNNKENVHVCHSFTAPVNGYYKITKLKYRLICIEKYENLPTKTVKNKNYKWWTFWKPKTVKILNFELAEKITSCDPNKVALKKGEVFFFNM